MSDKISRRQFLAALGGGLGALGLTGIAVYLHRLRQRSQGIFATDQSIRVPTEPIIRSTPKSSEPESVLTDQVESAQEPEPTLVQPRRVDLGSRVVHVHSIEATDWDFKREHYSKFVNQEVIHEMVDTGILELTGSSNILQAWKVIIPSYLPGRTPIAIKVNFNNSFYCRDYPSDCGDWQLKIDALVHPINSILRGLKAAYPNLAHNDVWLFDATIGDDPPTSLRKIPLGFSKACEYPGVSFFDQGCHEPANFSITNPDSAIAWYQPQGLPSPTDQYLVDVITEATYLINIPIMKRHGAAGVSLGFKNHFGSISDCPSLHDWVYLEGKYYSRKYNPLVDIYSNEHIQNKTALTIGDGLFGDRVSNYNKPEPWESFNGQSPNSLFFSTDPVAIDCVLCDFLDYEVYQGGIPGGADDYLRLAAERGLGVFERGEPWAEGYNNIEYLYFDL